MFILKTVLIRVNQCLKIAVLIRVLKSEIRNVLKELLMKRNTALKILNPVLLVLFINQVVTALFRDYIPQEAFEIFHKGAGFVLLSLILLHFILNFNWVKANYFSK